MGISPGQKNVLRPENCESAKARAERGGKERGPWQQPRIPVQLGANPSHTQRFTRNCVWQARHRRVTALRLTRQAWYDESYSSGKVEPVSSRPPFKQKRYLVRLAKQMQAPYKWIPVAQIAFTFLPRYEFIQDQPVSTWRCFISTMFNTLSLKSFEWTGFLNYSLKTYILFFFQIK